MENDQLIGKDHKINWPTKNYSYIKCINNNLTIDNLNELKNLLYADDIRIEIKDASNYAVKGDATAHQLKIIGCSLYLTYPDTCEKIKFNNKIVYDKSLDNKQD